LGGTLRRRLVRRLELEKILTEVPEHPDPKVWLEQYTIPPSTAAKFLHIAANVYDDVAEKKVVDLGCGTGRLAIGAAYLGAAEVVGVDIDPAAVRVASDCARKMGFKVNTNWIAGDLDALHGRFNTVLQNPPFGVQRRKADRKFLKKAIEIGRVVYSLHKSVSEDRKVVKSSHRGGTEPLPTSPHPFLKRFIENSGGKVKAVYSIMMTIPRTFNFHTERRHEFSVDLYVIQGREQATSNVSQMDEHAENQKVY